MLESTATTTPTRTGPLRVLGLRLNASLLVGGIIVALVLVATVAGPQLAPRDPLEENVIVQVGPSLWETPPFPAFTVPGFPLGSDAFGRDMLSRILWGIRPTMVMVALVAAVRLLLGTIIGVTAGWGQGAVGRTADNLISFALAIPVLLVALCAIAAVGAELGLPAFVIGLSINGWGESARIVREQTRQIKGADFVEAARALGELDLHIIFRHVMGHIMPLIWMLLALEVGSTLMVTAGLGFLGYYIGGDVWVEVGDFVARRISGTPELGQMLATGWARLDEPWPLVTTGTVVFTIVMGFNLVADGLRAQLNIERGQRVTALSERINRVIGWLEEHVAMPIFGLLSQPIVRPLLLLVVVVIIGGAAVWGWEQIAPAPVAVVAGETATGGGDGAAATDDAVVATPTPEAPPVILAAATELLVEREIGFGPLLALLPDGNLVALQDGDTPALLKLDRSGNVLAETPLDLELAGGPVVGDDGTVYIADRAGGLQALSPEGQTLWRVQSESGRPGPSGPALGPDGTVYYKSGGVLLAVAPAADQSRGEILWERTSSTSRISWPLIVSNDNQYVSWANDIFNVADGTLREHDFPFQVDDYRFGDDGNYYFRSIHTIVQWQPNGQAAEIIQSADWNYQGVVSPSGLAPSDYGVTPDGLMYILYTYDFNRGLTLIVWMQTDGEVVRTMNLDNPFNITTQWYRVEDNGEFLVCGSTTPNAPGRTFCRQVSPESDYPLWDTQLGPTIGAVVGGAYDEATGELFVAAATGELFRVETTNLIDPPPDDED